MIKKLFIIFAVTSALLIITCVTAFAAETGTITGSKVNIRDGASTGADVAGVVYRGDTVTVLEKSGVWYKVVAGTVQGYIHGDYIAVGGTFAEAPAVAADAWPKQGTVTGSSVNVRSEASTDSSVVTRVSSGAKLSALSEKDGWYQVETSSGKGYIFSDYFTLDGAASKEAAAAPETVRRGMVTGSTVNLRSKDSTDSDILDKLSPGTTVLVIEEGSSWHKVNYNGTVGYITADYLRVYDDSATSRSLPGASESDKATAAAIIAYAEQFLGVPYSYGGTSPRGFDCSGFVKYVFGNNGYSLPRTGTQQYNYGVKVSKSELQMGDVIAFTGRGTSKIQHVGIYIGDGQFIHSSSPGDTVKYDSIYSGYYKTYYYGACRIIL